MAKDFNPWKYAKAKDLDSLKNNPYINPKKEEPAHKPIIEQESPSSELKFL